MVEHVKDIAFLEDTLKLLEKTKSGTKEFPAAGNCEKTVCDRRIDA